MIRCKPERSSKQIVCIIVVGIILFLGCAVASSFVDGYKWAFELALIIIGVAAIAIVYRYNMTELEYELCSGEFNVYKTVGQKRTPACSLDLSTALSLTPKNEFTEKVQRKELPYIDTRYNFNQNIKCESPYVYVCEFNGKTVSIEFEPNEAFIEAMLDEIEKSKGNNN